MHDRMHAKLVEMHASYFYGNRALAPVLMDSYLQYLKYFTTVFIIDYDSHYLEYSFRINDRIRKSHSRRVRLVESGNLYYP